MYNRKKAVDYAQRWALDRNPAYYDYTDIGGDCTNFASQVLYAGYGEMNYKPVFGWYYIDGNRKSPSWTGVNELYNFVTSNRGPGPKAVVVDIEGIEPGDLVQLDFNGDGRFDHTPVITDVGDYTPDTVLLAAHTNDSVNRPLSDYDYDDVRFLHML
ncbi:MAG: amidase domain-containing protein [Clostridia bacterium]|nr:amidase domain-containing protein [Clostridia bacterium]